MLQQIDLSRTDLNLLVVFEAVLETRHVRRAAERLNLSPSAVSHALSRLRALLDDPVFIRTPRGVSPTERAIQLAPQIADILAQVRGVVASVAPFDPSRSERRFRLGAPDAISAFLLPPLLQKLRQDAPRVSLGVTQLLPQRGEPPPSLAWRSALAQLDERTIDLAILPAEAVPARFVAIPLQEEDFVLAVRADHPHARRLSLDDYCRAHHLVVSETGDPHGFVDVVLAERGLSRHVALTAPNFMLALALAAETDLICAAPRRLVARHAARFGLAAVEAPTELPRFQLCLIAPKPALQDAGLAWLVSLIAEGAS